MKEEGFDVRIVRYEEIHRINPKDEEAMIKAIDPRPHEKILDTFCGYGAVGKNCLEKEPRIDLWLNDESKVQMERAKENLPKIPSDHFILGHFPNISFPTGEFDKVVIKMGLHEVPKKEQFKVAKKAFEVLKPHGKFIIWDIMLNKDNQSLFQKIIRKKDELADFTLLVKERYFFTEDEFLEVVKSAGFLKIKDFHTIRYRFSSLNRLKPELKNDKNRLHELNNFIRQVFPEKLKKSLEYRDIGEDIQFNVTKKIYVMEK